MGGQVVNTLSFDPSSTRLGYADFDDCHLVECGHIRADKDALPVAMRIIQMAREVPILIDRYNPDFVLVEFFTEPPKSIGGSRGPALALCGQAYGAVLLAAMKADWGTWDPLLCVIPISNTWTKGTSKPERALLAARHKNYDPKQDTGADAADAIMMAEWWLKRRT